MLHRALCERLSALYAYALSTLFFLYLPFGGYARMMEEKYLLFLTLTLPYVLSMFLLSRRPRLSAMHLAAAALLLFSILSCLFSPYGASTLLGGTRKNGLLTAALLLFLFYFLSRHLHPTRKLLYAAGVSVTLCDALILLQLTGANPFSLYPEGLTYFDANIAYAGQFVGTPGNADFTAFLLTLAVCAFAAALLRGFSPLLLAPLALTLFCLWQLRIATGLVGLFAFFLFAPFLLLKKRTALVFSLSCLALALVFLWFYGGENGTLAEASALLHGEADPAFGSGRLAIWQQLLPHIKARPLLGSGCGTLHLLELKPFYWSVNGQTVHSLITDAHSEYLGLLAERGIFALLAYLVLLALALCRCIRRIREPRFAVCGALLVSYAAMAAFSVTTCITAPYLWLTLAIIAKNDD